MSYLGPLTKNLFDLCATELKKKKTKDTIIKNFIEPLTNEFYERNYYYFLGFSIIQILIILLLFIIIIKIK